MARKSWTLCSPETAASYPQQITSRDFPDLPGNWSVTSRLLSHGRSSGVHVVEVDNGAMRVALLPTRGMGLWQITRGDERLGWQSPVAGPVHPAHVPVFDPGGLGWLEGFDELMCRCGLVSNGAPDFDGQGTLTYPLHGRVANLPADEVEVMIDSESRVIAVQGVVVEARFHFQKLRLTAQYVTELGTTSVTWNDRVENFGGAPTDAQMLYHVNIGEPMLGPGAELVAPVAKVSPRDEVAANFGIEQWARYPEHDSESQEQVYFMELRSDSQGDSQVMVKQADGQAGAGLKFSLATLPYFTQWRNTPESADGYVTGIEPGTNFPNPRTVEASRGRVITLGPGCNWQTSLQLDWLTSATAVAEYEREIAAIAQGMPPELVPQPLAEWTTAAS